MHKWRQALSGRDRILVIYGSIISLLLLFYFMIWTPLSEKNAELIASNAQTRELIGWMKQARVQLVNLHQQTKTKVATNVSLLSAIEQSVKRNRLEASAADIKQLDTSRVQVTFAQVDYLAVLRWIDDLQTSSASKIDKVSIQKTEKPGIVRVDLTLLR